MRADIIVSTINYTSLLHLILLNIVSLTSFLFWPS